MLLFDFLFPKHCIQCKASGGYLCSNCLSYISFTDNMVCVLCQRESLDGLTHPVCKTKYSIDGVFPSVVYKGVVKKIVFSFKYSPYLTDMQKMISELLCEGVIQKELFYPLLYIKSVLVPIPLHKKKLRKRGYNQSYLLAKGIAERFGIPVIDCLERVKETKTQVGLSKELRQENIKGAFRVKAEFERIMKEYPQVFLVDDVVTSGATLKEAANTVKRAGVRHVWGVTFAHGE